MRLLFSLLCLALVTPAFTGCQTAPSARTAEVTTLKILGASVDASMKVAAQLLKDGKITWAQWDDIATFHDQKFQPAYNLAVAAVRSDLSSAASPDLMALFGSLQGIIAAYQPRTAP